jgi:hypothetical protein
MRKYITLFFSVLLFLTACSWSGTPNDVLSEDQMIPLLVDMHITDASLMNIPQAPDTLYKYGYGRYAIVFDKYHTDSAQFRKSYKYYTTKPVVFADMYDKILKILQAKSDSLNKLIVKQNMVVNKAVISTANGKEPTPVPGRPGLPGNVKLDTSVMAKKNRARMDSIRNKFLKTHHVVPK